jgi:hypothetical protein
MAPQSHLNEIERLAWTPMDVGPHQSEPLATESCAPSAPCSQEPMFDYEDVRDYDLGEGD